MRSLNRWLLSQLKAGIERHAPLAARIYRIVRDEVHYDRLMPAITPHGFKFFGDKAMQAGSFEPEETEIIKNQLEQADLLVDIGANTGLYTCMARSMGKHVVAIEPHYQNLRVLYRNIRENNWNDIEVWPIGLAADSSVVTLYGSNTGASVVKGWAEIPPSWNQTISVNTLDQVLGDRFSGQRLVIKVDVEGAEFGVLQGAPNTLQRTPKPVWLVEVTLTLNHPGTNKDFLNTFDAFWKRGYEVRTGDREQRLVTRADVERWAKAGTCDFGTHNWLFIPATR